MTYIDKNNETSQSGKEYIETWLSGIKGENAQGIPITYRDYISSRIRERSVTGAELWDLMIDKKPLKRSLLKEQGYVCCYCGRRIFNDHNTLIEHLEPKGGSLTNGTEEAELVNHPSRKVYDYQNIMASCMGGTKNIIHLVAGSEETKYSIAAKYGVSPDRIEELNIDEDNRYMIGKTYDFNEPIQVRDRVLIIKQTGKDQQHCGPQKDNDLIAIHPLLPRCFDYFIYATSGPNGVVMPANGEKKEEAEAAIRFLGLNNNAALKIDRKSAIDKARKIRDEIMSNDNKISLLRAQIASYSPDEKYAPDTHVEDARFYRKPFWFVELAIFLDKFNLNAE